MPVARWQGDAGIYRPGLPGHAVLRTEVGELLSQAQHATSSTPAGVHSFGGPEATAQSQPGRVAHGRPDGRRN